MRILLLTALIVAPLYYFSSDEEVVRPEIDSVRLKVSALKRPERVLTVNKDRAPAVDSDEVVAGPVVAESEEEAVSEETEEAEITETSEADPEHVPEVALSDLEEGWNNELKDILTRLEPADGEKLHESYASEQASYQAELDGLLNEKQQKTTEEAQLEVGSMILELDQRHQEKLKSLLGGHYEAVRDHYEDYMDSNSSDE